tara:strand:+ start:1439 stop:2428 length:990 start_codon:yes stop_codon:yes gene_type:complete
MTTPAPIKLLQWLIQHLKRPVATTGICSFGFLFGLFVVTGSIYPAETSDSPLEATGIFLLCSFLPAYLVMCMLGMLRNRPVMQNSLKQVLPDDKHALLTQIDKPRYWLVWVVIALVFAVTANISWSTLSFDTSNERFVFSLTVVFAQFVLWIVVGLALSLNFHNALFLHRLGKLASIDIYNLDSLNPFGRFTLSGLLMIVGAMALTPLQSIDAEFRWDNYRNAFVIVVPAAFVFLLLPIWSVHSKIKLQKRTQLQDIDEAIDKASKSFDGASLMALNGLLDRRQYIQHCRNRPMDTSIFSRVVLYVLIPPLAWIGAALVEVALSSALAG